MSTPLVAIVGRPNVGKSTLFNKLTGRRISIIEDTPAVTRDRIYAPCEWLNKTVMLVDTGGIEPFPNDNILVEMRKQSQIAIDNADVIIFVTDIRSGVTANDLEIANMLLKSGKPVVLCVNKCDNVGADPPELYEFYNLGLGDPFPVSAQHGHGSGDLLDEAYSHIDFEGNDDDFEGYIKVAIIGKPNVGKSSLINHILGEERMIVSNIPGTTRDATDSMFENEHGKYILIDTAGIRRKARVNESIERYSVLRSYMAVDRADVCLIIIDAAEGFTEQDSKIAGYANEVGKGSIIAINKWDLVEKETNTMRDYAKQLEGDFGFMRYAPFIFISAVTGERVNKIFAMINDIYQQNSVRIPTGKLNEMLAYATARAEPPSDKGKRLKLYYITQASTNPPTFVVFVNTKKLFHFSYKRYLENQLREYFTLNGTPIRLVVRERGESKSK